MRDKNDTIFLKVQTWSTYSTNETRSQIWYTIFNIKYLVVGENRTWKYFVYKERLYFLPWYQPTMMYIVTLITIVVDNLLRTNLNLHDRNKQIL